MRTDGRDPRSGPRREIIRETVWVVAGSLGGELLSSPSLDALRHRGIFCILLELCAPSSRAEF